LAVTRQVLDSQLLFVAALTLTLGCSGSKFDAQVSGTIRLDDNPIGPGVVIFAPADAKTNPARGAIQPDGTYTLKTGRDIGLPPGKYQVSLQIVELPADVVPGQRDMRPTKSLIPQRYTDTTTSGFEFEVMPGDNTIDIEMTTSAAPARPREQ